MPAGFTFKLHEGDTFALMFRLRKRGQNAAYPLDPLVHTVRLELERGDGTVLTPIAASSTHPDADWAKGLVPVQVDPSQVTLRPDTLTGVLVVAKGTENFGLPHEGEVVIEVSERGGLA